MNFNSKIAQEYHPLNIFQCCVQAVWCNKHISLLKESSNLYLTKRFRKIILYPKLYHSHGWAQSLCIIGRRKGNTTFNKIYDGRRKLKKLQQAESLNVNLLWHMCLFWQFTERQPSIGYKWDTLHTTILSGTLIQWIFFWPISIAKLLSTLSLLKMEKYWVINDEVMSMFYICQINF